MLLLTKLKCCLIRGKARKSHAFIVVSLLINHECGYTIFSLLDLPYSWKIKKLKAFIVKKNNALAGDGLAIKDCHRGNFGYDEQGWL